MFLGVVCWVLPVFLDDGCWCGLFVLSVGNFEYDCFSPLMHGVPWSSSLNEFLICVKPADKSRLNFCIPWEIPCWMDSCNSRLILSLNS